MPNCAACGCPSGKKPEHRRSVSDSVSAAGQGAAAESDQRGTGISLRSFGRALRKQRSRWLHLSGPQRVRRVLFYGIAPVMLAALPFMFAASSDDRVDACPDSAAPTAQTLPTMLNESGAIEKFDLTDKGSIAVTIYAGDQNQGEELDMRRQIGRLMRELHQVAECFPAVKLIRADLLAPGTDRHDEHGNALAGFEIPIVSLSISTADLRAFKQDFEWESYPIYAANRYARAINLNFSEVWHRELEREEETGDFVDSL